MDTVDAVRRDWGASGLAQLTGLPSGPPDFSRAGVLAAARSVAESLVRGGGEVVDVAMAAVAATYAALPEGEVADDDCPAATPKEPGPQPLASELGADNQHVERLIAERRLTSC
jgi:hypothetical protein